MIGTVYCDSLSAIRLAKDRVHHERTKHIDVRYHFPRNEKRIQVKKVGTADNPADMFTKPVPRSKFKHCLDLLEDLKSLVAPKGEQALDKASGLRRGIGSRRSIGSPAGHRAPGGASGSGWSIGLRRSIGSVDGHRAPVEQQVPHLDRVQGRSILVSMKHPVLRSIRFFDRTSGPGGAFRFDETSYFEETQVAREHPGLIRVYWLDGASGR
ncbi:Retrovirus-related Pol polyprotein from transposon TNT 1-94 [Cardamine amara subsp. amara]|uniref:Retrovirus-related Pol polyprotein from transposon TNT 1-94 n=1 Tax=Cardamine amara subsp. amara TaxID=228776 RepID=A0ABD1ABW9_CARAN